MRFNKKAIEVSKTTNLAGGEAYTETPKLELVSHVLTSFVKDQFYRSADTGLDRVKELVDQIGDTEFVAKLALFARHEYHMRSISHVLAAHVGAKFVNEPSAADRKMNEISKSVRTRGAEWKKKFFDRIVVRPDDMTEILSFYGQSYGKPFPNAMKRGFAKALERQDEYKLAKYRGEGHAVSMVDVVNLVHPKHTEPIGKLVRGELKSTETWESKLTEAGKIGESDEEKADLKVSAWKDLLRENKLGYFALLRNLRNIIQTGDKSLIRVAEQALINRERIKKSKVLPFRYLSAMKALEGVAGSGRTIGAVSQALDLAVDNCPELPGKTCVILDTSASMTWSKSKQGIGSPMEIGSLFAAVLVKANNADLIHFSDSAGYLNCNPQDSVMGISNWIASKAYAGGTNIEAAFQEMRSPYDRLIILSDMQVWRGMVGNAAYNQYCRCIKERPIIYSFDLQGYGTLQFPERNVFCLAGFSEHVFEMMKLFEQDRNALINTVEGVVI